MKKRKYVTTYGQCRCCLTKGHHRDLKKEYYVNGIRVVYFDIFLECFNLFLSTSASLSTLICTSCVQKLREANSFRMMVVSTEKKLLGRVDNKETVFVNVPVDDHMLNPELDIKQEDPDVMKDELNDIDLNNTADTYSGDSSSEPELIEGETELLSRFPRNLLKLPTRSSLYDTCSGYIKHLDSLRGKVIIPKMIEKILKESEDRRRKKITYVTEKIAHVINATTLLEYSNITAFKTKTRSGFPCYYCKTIFENLSTLQEHQTSKHSKADIRKNLSKYGADFLVIYADVTDLKCTICNENIHSLNELKLHLTRKHKKKMHLEFTDRVIPFKLADNTYECQICGFNFETFGSIERHMNTHFRNYVCEECGAGFITKHRLKVHLYSLHISGNFPCELCKKVYTTHQKYKTHVDAVHKMVKRNKCPKCPERFSDYFGRQRHMVKVHGLAPLQYKCNVCDKVFNRRYMLSNHMKRNHLEERNVECELCTYKCYTKSELRVHMVKHNGERMFECSVCKKSYARKKTLKEHMKIHNNDRRFACVVCGQTFVQNCSLKGHMKTHHSDYFNTLQ